MLPHHLDGAARQPALGRQACSHCQSADGMCSHDHAQTGQLREYPAFDQSDEGCPIHGATREQRPDEAVGRHLLGQRLRSDGMREYRYSELRGDLERGSRLRRVDQQVTARTVDEEPAQSELGDGPLGLAGGPISVVSVKRSEAINVSGVSRYECGEFIIHRHNCFMWHVPVRICDQVAWYIDYPCS